MYYIYLSIIVYILRKIYQVSCTIDINISELEYLAAHLESSECRQLIAALHYTTYNLPKSIDGAVRKLDEDVPCLHHLLHWNSSPGEGKGKTHEELGHRLRQINRNDLADWLGKTVFKELGRDIDEAFDKAFDNLGGEDTEVQYHMTIEPTEEPREEDPWETIDMLLLMLVVVLLVCLLYFMVAIAVHKIKMHIRNKKICQPLCKSGMFMDRLNAEEEDNLLDSDIELMSSEEIETSYD